VLSLLTALDPMLMALDPTEGMALLTTLDPMLTAVDPTEGMALLTAPDLTEGMPTLTALVPTERMAFSTAPVPTRTDRMAFLMAADPTAGTMEVGRLSVPGSTEDDLKMYPNYHVGAADWSRVTATNSETSKLPNSRTTPKETSSRPTTTRSPSNGSRNQSRLSTLGSPEESLGRLLYHSLASYYVLAALGPEDLNLLATSGHVASAPAPTDSQSLTTPGSKAYSSCLLRSSTTYPMGSNASVTQLSQSRLHPPHRRAPHVSLVLKEPRVRS